MKTIRISNAVWAAIAERGKFGETEDDVLRRVFEIPSGVDNNRPTKSNDPQGRGSPRHSVLPMSSQVEGACLSVTFRDGHAKDWNLSLPTDKAATRRVRDEAFAFARAHGATQGQLDAITKALNAGGYYITGPRSRRSSLAERIANAI
jgi:hypothetical protein